MIKTWIKAAIYIVIAAIIGILTTTVVLQGEHLKDCRKQVAEQGVIIDSLLKVKKTYFNVDLHVTDRSVSKVYGSHNKGSITMPSERTYKLVIDSVNVKMR